MAYGALPDALDKYLLMGATTARKCLQMFFKAIMELYGEEFLRKPTYTDMEKLYAYHEEKYEFLEMLGSIECTVLIESIKNPGTNDHKRILYKTKHEATRKDV
nr:putative harbinger transposase-derived protein [Tanacetum cinerariifolium]